VLLALILLAGVRRGTALDPPALGVWLVGVAATLAAGDAALIGTTLAVEKVVGGGSLGGSLVGLVAGSATLLAIAAAWRARLLGRGALVLDPLGEPAPGSVVLGIGYILAGLVRVGIVLAAVIPLLHLPESDPGSEIRELVNGGLHPAGTALLVLAAVVVAPIVEETLFRGVLLPWLRRFLSPDAAAWASAWVFAAGHLRYGVHVLVVLVYGLVLAWARMRTGRLRASIALHMIINATALAVTLLHG
jgi:membrane protease YdiL (CAAX protease family)